MGQCRFCHKSSRDHPHRQMKPLRYFGATVVISLITLFFAAICTTVFAGPHTGDNLSVIIVLIFGILSSAIFRFLQTLRAKRWVKDYKVCQQRGDISRVELAQNSHNSSIPTPPVWQCERYSHRVMQRTFITDHTRWYPVYSGEPITKTSEVYVHNSRWGARCITIDAQPLIRCGRCRSKPPRGELSTAPRHHYTYARQLRIDSLACLGAPIWGLLWYSVDPSFPDFLGATCVATPLVLWWQSWKGSDPT